MIRDWKAVVPSRDVARVFEKPLNDLLKAIRNLECSEEFRLGIFSQSSYINDQNREMPEIIMSRDGFSFFAMGFTGVRAARWKELYIAAFNDMEKGIARRTQRGQTYTIDKRRTQRGQTYTIDKMAGLTEAKDRVCQIKCVWPPNL